MEKCGFEFHSMHMHPLSIEFRVIENDIDKLRSCTVQSYVMSCHVIFFIKREKFDFKHDKSLT